MKYPQHVMGKRADVAFDWFVAIVVIGFVLFFGAQLGRGWLWWF